MNQCKYNYTNSCDAGPVGKRSGMCRFHYRRMWRGINPEQERRDGDWHKYIELELQENGCWNWIGKMGSGGYGAYRDRCAHRVIYELEKNVVLDRKTELDHLCLNKICVNPEHLDPVTRKENLRRRHAIRTACRNGHDLTVPDAYRPDHGFECYRCYKNTADRSNAHAKARREAAKIGH